MRERLYSQTISSRDAIPEVIAAAGSCMRAWTTDPREVYTISLALDELLTNMFDHGFKEGTKHYIEISFVRDGQLFEITTMDNGKKFNCTKAATPEVHIPFPLREQKVGGMGIHLVKKLMDVFTYRRENDMNVIVIGKYLNGEKQLCNYMP